MPAPAIEKIPGVITHPKPDLVWRTVLFNCYCHTFDEVIAQIMKAVRCPYTTASQLANVADQLGSVTVYKGSKENCEDVASVLGAIGLEVQVAN